MCWWITLILKFILPSFIWILIYFVQRAILLWVTRHTNNMISRKLLILSEINVVINSLCLLVKMIRSTYGHLASCSHYNVASVECKGNRRESGICQHVPGSVPELQVLHIRWEMDSHISCFAIPRNLYTTPTHVAKYSKTAMTFEDQSLRNMVIIVSCGRFGTIMNGQRVHSLNTIVLLLSTILGRRQKRERAKIRYDHLILYIILVIKAVYAIIIFSLSFIIIYCIIGK